MGTRSAAKIKLRSAPFKCDICCRRLMSAEALRSHQFCIHHVKNKIKPKTASKQTVTKLKTQPQTQKMKNNKLEKPKATPTKKVAVNSIPVKKIEEKKIGKRGTKTIETCNEYECPKCFQSFPDYFLAHRHIQKYHCVDSNNEKVSPNSTNLIKPDVKLVCAKCNRRPKSLETHKCSSYKLDDATNKIVLKCMACNEQFHSLRLFDIHVSGLHCDGVESMFFPTSEVFLSWKEDLMKQTGVQYYELGNYNYKQMLRCPCVPDGDFNDDIKPCLCPSSIVVQELTKGTQVHYYKNHYGHKCGSYVLPDIYKKYTLTKLIQNEEAYTEIDSKKANETEIYQQFIKLMECIVQDSANVQIETLKILLTKAFDMTTVFNNENDNETDENTYRSVAMKLLIENKVMGLLKSDKQVGKRKAVLNEKKTEPITKRFKTRTYQNKDSKSNSDDGSIKIVNSYSLAEQEIVNAINDENIEVKDEMPKKEEIPEKDETPEKDEIPEKDTIPENDIKDIQPEEKDVKVNSVSPSFVDSYKVFVKQLSEPGQRIRKKKNMCKIKSERHSAEEITVKKEIEETDIKKDKPVDYKYEIKEQENDCNILILKI